jgi:hypothetical protein
MRTREVADLEGVERIVVTLMALNRRLDALLEQLRALRDPPARGPATRRRLTPRFGPRSDHFIAGEFEEQAKRLAETVIEFNEGVCAPLGILKPEQSTTVAFRADAGSTARPRTRRVGDRVARRGRAWRSLALRASHLARGPQ